VISLLDADLKKTEITNVAKLGRGSLITYSRAVLTIILDTRTAKNKED